METMEKKSAGNQYLPIFWVMPKSNALRWRDCILVFCDILDGVLTQHRFSTRTACGNSGWLWWRVGGTIYSWGAYRARDPAGSHSKNNFGIEVLARSAASVLNCYIAFRTSCVLNWLLNVDHQCFLGPLSKTLESRLCMLIASAAAIWKQAREPAELCSFSLCSLDGVVDYLPQPDEVQNVALQVDKDEEPLPLDASHYSFQCFGVPAAKNLHDWFNRLTI